MSPTASGWGACQRLAPRGNGRLGLHTEEAARATGQRPEARRQLIGPLALSATVAITESGEAKVTGGSRTATRT